ncbi:hypothetical protein MKX01_032597 [Papaver californicum]|nr:hypothetical protein MKX01_032588 [Papaver californicum]KAI3926409.1 hypothetical protein MKX01_032597 [Papaver californicum]
MASLVDWSDHVSSSANFSSLSFPRLERLSIIGCDNLRSTPTRFPSLIAVDFRSSNGKPIRIFIPYALLRGNNILTKLEIWYCEKFGGFVPNQDLEEKEIQNQVVIPNTCLDTLRVNHCPAISCRLDVRGFNSLRELDIGSCSKSLKCIPNGIQYLPKLDDLTIGPLSEELDYFPFPAGTVDEKGTVIGDYFPSLSSLTIEGWSKLQSLPDDLQYIKSLKYLRIWDFHSLVALPEWVGNFPSLRLLAVRRCENLMHLPSQKQMQRLASLQILHIAQCQVLIDRCEEGGEESYKISHIPMVDYAYWVSTKEDTMIERLGTLLSSQQIRDIGNMFGFLLQRLAWY